MPRTRVTYNATVLVRLGVTAAMMVFTLSAVAQTSGSSSGKATAPPAGWTETWVGMYETQGGFNSATGSTSPTLLPPGYTARDRGEPVYSLLQPWARERTDATNPDMEDLSQLCWPHSSQSSSGRKRT